MYIPFSMLVGVAMLALVVSSATSAVHSVDAVTDICIALYCSACGVLVPMWTFMRVHVCAHVRVRVRVCVCTFACVCMC